MEPPTYVILSTFPPLHCGIARYAAQHAECLRRQGGRVVTIGLPGSEADSIVDARGGRNPLRVLGAARALGAEPRESSLAIHWHDDHYFLGGFRQRLPTAIALARLLSAFADTEIICHETYPAERVHGVAKAVLRALYVRARRWAWLHATRLAFHSDSERRQAEEAHGGRWPDARVVVRSHSEFLGKHRDITSAEARQELGIPAGVFLFLCIGFWSEHKGYHLAAEALHRIADDRVRLAIVGSVREETPEALAYARRLREVAAAEPRVQLVERFVSDEEYDTWTCAADVVVAPYQKAFSSSVIARAKLFGRRVIVTGVGGLADQIDGDDFLVGNPAELAEAMTCAAGAGPCA